MFELAIFLVVVGCVIHRYIEDQREKKIKSTKGRVVYRDSKTKSGVLQICVKDQCTGDRVILVVPYNIYDKYREGDFFDEK